MGGKNEILGIGLLQRLQNVIIIGENNIIDIRSALPKSVHIFIYGDNHKLFIDEGVIFKKGVIWFEDASCEIHIGAGTTIEEAHLAVAERGSKLTIGKDCMFSKNIHISTTDSHSIIDLKSGSRTNPSQDIVIGNHVWLGYSASINKGVVVGNNSVVAGHSVVTKSIPSNTISAGVPARVVKKEISWNRIRL